MTDEESRELLRRVLELCWAPEGYFELFSGADAIAQRMAAYSARLFVRRGHFYWLVPEHDEEFYLAMPEWLSEVEHSVVAHQGRDWREVVPTDAIEIPLG